MPPKAPVAMPLIVTITLGLGDTSIVDMDL